MKTYVANRPALDLGRPPRAQMQKCVMRVLLWGLALASERELRELVLATLSRRRLSRRASPESGLRVLCHCHCKVSLASAPLLWSPGT